ncbi:MAG: hypothetical protein SVJ22_05965 [Halobacteriota archaeon]|nr:hypothetical protein [Halobacteriota archaeon]
MEDFKELYALLHLETTLAQSSLNELIGQARNAVVRMTADKMTKYDLPPLDDLITIIKNSLDLEDLSYYKDQNGYHLHIDSCPAALRYGLVSCSGGSGSICPIIFLCLCSIMKETGVEAEVINVEHGKDGIEDALIRPYFSSWEELILRVSEDIENLR